MNFVFLKIEAYFVAVLFILTILPFAAVSATFEAVEGNASSKGYFLKYSDEIAQYNAKNVLKKQCKAKGLTLYGQQVGSKHSKDPHEVTYSHLQCKEKKGSGNKRCTIHAKGYCISPLSTSFVFSCSKGHKEKGQLVSLPHGGKQIIMRNGDVINLSPQTVKEGAGSMFAMICGKQPEVNSKLVKKLRFYFRQKVNALIYRCKGKSFKKKHTDSCQSLLDNSVAIGVRG